MARKSTKVTAPEAEVVAVESTVVGNPFAALATQPEAVVAPTARAVMLAKAEANGFAATVNGEVVKAAANVAARAANLGKLPVHIANGSYTLARVPKTKVPYTVASLQGLLKVGDVGHTAKGAEWATHTTGDFVGYAVKSGWLIPA